MKKVQATTNDRSSFGPAPVAIDCTPDKSVAVASKGREFSARDALIECMDNAEFWQDADGNSFVTVLHNGIRKHFSLESRGFKRLLSGQYYLSFNHGATINAIKEAIATFDAKAVISEKILEPSLRFARADGKLYLDLCNDSWDVVEISADGWNIVKNVGGDVRFIRKDNMHSLPRPITPGDGENPLEELRALLNTPAESWRLLLSCVIACFDPSIARPILMLQGEQGSGKSLLLTILRKLIDPNKANARNLPREEDELFIMAANNAIMFFDNVSGLPAWLSDAFCKICTGGGYSKRTLYENADEFVLEAKRPIWLNGISRFINRDDMAERTTTIFLDAIEQDKRKLEQEILSWFNANHARLLGALVEVVSSALRNLPNTSIVNKPRMADFALFASAAAPSLGWNQEEFLLAFNEDKQKAQRDLVQNTILGLLIVRFLTSIENQQWEGSASELLEKLRNLEPAYKNDLPKSPRILSSELGRLTPALRTTGLLVKKGHNRGGSFIQMSFTSQPTTTREERDAELHARASALRPDPESDFNLP